MNGKIKTILILLLIIGGIAYFSYQHYKKEAPKESSEAQKIESQKEILIRELAEKYNALVGWNQTKYYYTVQLQDLFINSDIPILFEGYVDDIFIKDGQYYIRFYTGMVVTIWYWVEPGEEPPPRKQNEVYFVLKCDSNKVSEIINSETPSNWYVVVGKIENVTKPILQISGYSEYESEEVELEYKPSDTFIATGVCIDFSYIEEE